ncbi:MAG: hypothetical protein ACI8QZ_003081 [Chlamydiales bacterium]|jgi:hypothetical protein
MWKITAIAFTIAFLVGGLLIEVLRLVVDRRRRVNDGLGGSQDMAMAGTIARIVCGVLAVVAWVGWILTR